MGAGSRALEQSSSASEVLLVTMPFGPLTTPSLALSILRPILERETIACETWYANIDFATRIGPIIYECIASGLPRAHDLVGEFIFSRALFDRQARSSDDFITYLHENFGHERVQHFYAASEYLLGELQKNLDNFRDQADKFVSDAAQRIAKLNPKVLALTSAFQQNTASLALAKKVKELGATSKILVGGSNCEGDMGKAIFEYFPFIDGVCTGEAEPIAVECVSFLLGRQQLAPIGQILLRGATASKETPNLVFHDFASVPPPKFDEFFQAYALANLPFPPKLLFETSRGCWWGEKHHCTFCGLNGGTMAFRRKAPELALEQLGDVAQKYPGVTICMTDNIMDYSYLKSLVPEIVKRSMALDLFYEMKANLRYDQLELLSAAGINRIQPGIESFSDHVLELMDKGISALQNIQLLKWCRELDIDPAWNMLWGFPGERAEDYAEMAQLIPKLTHLKPPAGVGRLRLDRFSPYYEKYQWKFSDVRPFASYGLVYPLDREAVARLAYFFDGRIAGDDAVARYTGDLRAAVASWKDGHEAEVLCFADTHGVLTVFDSRAGFSEGVTMEIFIGVERLIILSGASITSVEKMFDGLASLAERQDFDRALTYLEERGYVLRIGDKVLSLPVKMNEKYPSPQFWERVKTASAVSQKETPSQLENRDERNVS